MAQSALQVYNTEAVLYRSAQSTACTNISCPLCTDAKHGVYCAVSYVLKCHKMGTYVLRVAE
jgi:hypothetical protein